MTTENQGGETADRSLRDPDNTVSDGRTTTLLWNLGPDPEGGTRQVALSISHHISGRGGSFTATLMNRAEDGATTRMGATGDWTRIKVEPAARYSKTALERFTTAALEHLRALYSQDDEEGVNVRSYFGDAEDHELDYLFEGGLDLETREGCEAALGVCRDHSTEQEGQ